MREEKIPPGYRAGRGAMLFVLATVTVSLVAAMLAADIPRQVASAEHRMWRAVQTGFERLF